MKQRILITAVLLLPVCFGIANAFQFRVAANTYEELGVHYWMSNLDAELWIYVNNDDITRLGMSSPFKIYGTESITEIEFSTDTSWIVSPEFREIWDMGTWSSTYSWDGSLTTPDQFCFQGMTMSGWEPGEGEMLAFTFIFEVVAPYDCMAEPGNICIDAGGFGGCDWLFDGVVLFGGPYCWPVRAFCCRHSEFTNCVRFSVEGVFGREMSYDFDTYNPVVPQTFAKLLSGPGTMDSVTGVWSWTPGIEDVGVHHTVVLAYDNEMGCTGDRCFFDAVVLTPPCGDANGDDIVNLLDITYLISFLYKEGAAPVPIESADVDNSGGVDILDITYLIAFLYKAGPAPECPFS